MSYDEPIEVLMLTTKQNLKDLEKHLKDMG